MEDVKPIKSVTMHRGDGTASKYDYDRDGNQKLHSTIKSDVKDVKIETEYWD